MDRHRLVELGLGGTHLQGDGHSLQDLVNAPPDGMHSHHVLFSIPKVADQFEEGGEFQVLVLRKGVEHVVELAGIDLDLFLTPLGHGLFLVQTHHPDRRVGEDDGRHEGQVSLEGSLLGVEEPFDEGAAYLDGHGGELGSVGDITYCVDALLGGVLVLIHLYIALLVQLHPRLLQGQRLHIRHPPDGHQDAFGLQAPAVL